MFSRIITGLICALLFSCTITSSAYSSNGKMVFSGMDSPHAKVVFNVLKEAYSELGIEIEHRSYPILRSIKSAGSGKVDGQLFKVAGIEEEYTELIKIPVPVDYFELTVLKPSGTPDILQWNDLKDLKVGYYRGVFYLKKKTALEGIIDTREIDTHEQLVKMIQHGRIDVALTARIAGWQTLQGLKSEQVVLQRTPIQKVYVHHYLNKKHSSIVPKITSILRKMQSNGRISQIRQEILKEELGNNYNSFL